MHDKQKILSHINAMLEELGIDPVSIPEEPKPWPQVEDGYWFVATNGIHRYVHWQADKSDLHFLATGNCHRTEAEALAYREWQKDPRVVARGMIERMEGFDPTGRFEIRSVNGKKFSVLRIHNGFWGSLTFSNERTANAILEAYPDLLKVALGVITNKEEGSRIVREAMGK